MTGSARSQHPSGTSADGDPAPRPGSPARRPRTRRAQSDPESEPDSYCDRLMRRRTTS